MSTLPWTIYIPFIGALLFLFTGKRHPETTRWLALATAVSTLAIGLFAAFQFTPSPNGPEDIINLTWISQVGARYHLAADGISMTLVILTGIAATAGVLFSWNITEKVGEFFAFYFLLIGGVYGVFMSADAFLFFIFYEIAIIPKYFLIARWGSTNREYAAMKLVLYSFIGGTLVFIGIIWVHVVAGISSFNIIELAQATQVMSPALQITLFALVFFGFAILAGIFPFHTWAPTGHVAAPTAASMLLAGVVMKLGAYGCLRLGMEVFPGGFAFWQPYIAWLAIIGIVYAGFVALVQDDFKFVIGYSSISHMGFVLLGLAACNEQAISGAVLQMFSHGVIAGLLFAVVGRMVYDRTHTRDLAVLRKLPLYRMLPFAAFTFVIAGFASMGFPGFSGFPAELSILIGAWQSSHIWAVCAGLGIILAGAFTLRAIYLSFFGTTDIKELAARPVPTLPPITWPERIGTTLLIATIILIGIKPDLLLNWIIPSLQSPTMQTLLSKGGAL